VIGLIVEAYCLGRADAKAGRRVRANHRGPRAWDRTHAIYRLGYRDEVRRMREERRLAQFELDLHQEYREGA
jgi:hypothetical protein